MAEIISENGKKVTLNNRDSIVEACKELGVTFDCLEGHCGVCGIEITKGWENLSELTNEEKELGKDKKHRLACQCKIKKGTVKIKF